MTQFSVSESGLFSAGAYDEASSTLTLVFRTSGETYIVRGVAKPLGERFMTQPSKSSLWHSEIKHLGPVKA